MANDVTNMMTILVSKEKLNEALAFVHVIESKLSDRTIELRDVFWESPKDVPDQFDGRTRYLEGRFMFRSAWGPASALQDRICELFCHIDSNVIVENRVTEEFNSFFMMRYSFLASDNEVESLVCESDGSEELERLQREIETADDEEDYDREIELSEQFDDECSRILDELEDKAHKNKKLKSKRKDLCSID